MKDIRIDLEEIGESEAYARLVVDGEIVAWVGYQADDVRTQLDAGVDNDVVEWMLVSSADDKQESFEAVVTEKEDD